MSVIEPSFLSRTFISNGTYSRSWIQYLSPFDLKSLTTTSLSLKWVQNNMGPTLRQTSRRSLRFNMVGATPTTSISFAPILLKVLFTCGGYRKKKLSSLTTATGKICHAAALREDVPKMARLQPCVCQMWMKKSFFSGRRKLEKLKYIGISTTSCPSTGTPLAM